MPHYFIFTHIHPNLSQFVALFVHRLLLPFFCLHVIIALYVMINWILRKTQLCRYYYLHCIDEKTEVQKWEIPANCTNPVTGRVGIWTKLLISKAHTFSSYNVLLCYTKWHILVLHKYLSMVTNCDSVDCVLTFFIFQKMLPLWKASNIFQRASYSGSY